MLKLVPSSLLRIGALAPALFVLAAASTGCAFANVDVHPPEVTASKTPQGTGPGRGREVIVFSPFTDDRHERPRCGMQKNGYNMDTADVICSEPPGRWIADALALELAKSGFKPLRADAVPGPTTVVVRGTVGRLFLEPKHDFFTLTVEGDIAAQLVVTTPNGLRAERKFYVKGKDTDMASTEATFQAAADRATRQIARAMVSALIELLDKYPELGAPSATAMVVR